MSHKSFILIKTYVDTPELLNGVKGDDLLQQLCPVVVALFDKSVLYLSRSLLGAYLGTRRLGEPQSPLVLKGVLDVEVVLVVEDSDGLGAILDVVGVLLAIGGDGNGGQVDLLVHVLGVGRGSSHD
jgi:hypothetical protein